MKIDDSNGDYCVIGGWQELMPRLSCRESRATHGRSMVVTVLLGAHTSLRRVIILQLLHLFYR